MKLYSPYWFGLFCIAYLFCSLCFAQSSASSILNASEANAEQGIQPALKKTTNNRIKTSSLITNRAAGVYAEYEHSIFQIRLMEKASGSQSSLGTGFLVLDGTTWVTNYHVIAATLFEPEKYRIECDVEGKDEKLELVVVGIDVVNDLAILRAKQESKAEAFKSESLLGKPFLLREEPPSKGETLYSLGNPHDLGMTVVEGNYNGLVEHRFRDQIHFSGAVNSGMSGGPAVNQAAEVIGVNVATAGNQIGFLVPVQALILLLEKLDDRLQAGFSHQKNDDFLGDISTQINQYTESMVSTALQEPWQSSEMGKVNIQSSPLPWLECWGDSHKSKKRKTYKVSRGCHSGSALFLSHGFSTGFIEYEFMFFEAPTWPSASVYRYLAKDTAQAAPANYGPKKQLGAFTCSHSQVENKAGVVARISYCQRPYKKIDGLNDVFYMAVTVDKEKMAAMSHFTLAGVNNKAAQQFLTHFIEVLAWPQ